MKDRTETLRDRYLAAASELFLERGFEGATTEEIARRARGSKATLYKLFGDKDGLLIAVVDRARVQILSPFAELGEAPDVRSALVGYGVALLTACTSPAIVELHRLVISRVRQQPGLGEAYHAKVTAPSYEALTAALARFHQRGAIHCPDPERTAERLLGVVASRVLLRVLLEGRYPLGEHEIQGEAEACIEQFLDGVRRPPSAS
jgi:AcrR family transcriptional regulator